MGICTADVPRPCHFQGGKGSNSHLTGEQTYVFEEGTQGSCVDSEVPWKEFQQVPGTRWKTSNAETLIPFQ
jgi:hypothetical protein